MVLFKKKDTCRKTVEYDPETQIPILRCSICNGEQVAGFKDLRSGSFTEVCLIRDSKELDEFKLTYGLSDITKEY
ncbi:MAG: aspartate dehydrogenase [Lachnospiraceae bacterium]|nr:aspartate dehydrogenase [Lachnospiraceae bacterium]